jgi:hypothetical protein
MSIKVSIQNVIHLGGGQGALLVTGLLIPSNAPAGYVTGGDIVDFTQAVADPALVGGAGPFIDSSLPVEQFDCWSQSGYVTNPYYPIVGTKQNNCKMKVLNAYGNAAELAQGNYPAGVLTDSIAFSAILGNLI